MMIAERLSILVLATCLLCAGAYGERLNVTHYPGSDIGQQINAAYAALPPTGGALYVPAKKDGTCYQFSTPIQFNTLHKTVVVEGDSLQSTCLQYLGSGTAVSFDYGFEHYLVGATLKNLTLQGTGNQGTGLILGGSNGAEGTRIENVRIAGFGLGVIFGYRSWGSKFDHVVIDDNEQNLYYPPSLQDTGENLEFIHVIFGNNTNVNIANSIVINGANGSPPDFNFVDCSFDAVQVVLTVGYINMVNPHFENAANHSDLDYLVINGAYVNIVNPFFLQNFFSGPIPSQFIRATQGLTVLVGVKAYTNQIIPRFMFLQGTASALVLGEINVQNFTTDIVKDVGATGYVAVHGAYGSNYPLLLSNNVPLAWQNSQGIPTEIFRVGTDNSLLVRNPGGNINYWNNAETAIVGAFADNEWAIGPASISTSGDAHFNSVTTANPTPSTPASLVSQTQSQSPATGTGKSEAAFSGVLSFGSIPAETCKEDDISNARSGTDTFLVPIWPALESGLTGMMYVDSSKVRVRVCNVTSHPISASAHQFGGRFIQ
jgi:hypothetical protein